MAAPAPSHNGRLSLGLLHLFLLPLDVGASAWAATIQSHRAAVETDGSDAPVVGAGDAVGAVGGGAAGVVAVAAAAAAESAHLTFLERTLIMKVGSL